MIQKFRQHITRHHLCSKNDKILAAVSGGVDSVVMLDLLVQSGFKPAVAHCNFHLRGDESDGDEAFVRQLAKKYGLPVFVHQCHAAGFAKEHHISIEMAARDLRYTWFEKLMYEHHFQKLAIGHNRDDDAETFFINLFRSSGLHGLKGIPVERNHIIRPILFASRDEILQYANNQKLNFREDSTNATDDYLRNRIRHHLMPFMEDNFPGSRDGLAGSLEKLKENDALFELLLKEKKEQIFESSGNGYRIPKKMLRGFPKTNILLYYLLRDFGFNRSQTDQINTSINNNQNGQIFNSGTYRLLSDRDCLFIEPVSTNQSKTWPVELKSAEIKTPVNLQTRLLPNDSTFVLKRAKNIAYFDADKLTEPLVLRKWKKGDRFEPFGMRGSKLLSDFFIDEKFSRFEKENTWLLVSGNTILWVVGHRATRHFSITPQTRTVFMVHLKSGL